MNKPVMTPEAYPQHPTIGRFFSAGIGNEVYFCDSYEPRLGFWMTNVVDASDRRNVSEMAINRTFHTLDDSSKPKKDEGRHYWAVDTRLPPAQWTATRVTEAEAAKTHPRVALFFFDGDEKQFIERVRNTCSARKLAAGAAITTE